MLEQLGFGSENGTWRAAFLSGSMELRGAAFGTPTSPAAADLLAQLTPELFFDAVAVQVDGPKAWESTSRRGGRSPTTTVRPIG